MDQLVFPSPPLATGLVPHHTKGRRYDKKMKEQFAKNLIKHGGIKKHAYQATFPDVLPESAEAGGVRLFKDPYVQEVYRNSGVDVHYLARRSKDLMESGNEQVASGMVKLFVKPLLDERNVQRTERISVSLFGELTDGTIDLIKKGKKIDQRGRTQNEAAGA